MLLLVYKVERQQLDLLRLLTFLLLNLSSDAVSNNPLRISDRTFLSSKFGAKLPLGTSENFRNIWNSFAKYYTIQIHSFKYVVDNARRRRGASSSASFPSGRLTKSSHSCTWGYILHSGSSKWVAATYGSTSLGGSFRYSPERLLTSKPR